jgi:hypothetical protein
VRGPHDFFIRLFSFVFTPFKACWLAPYEKIILSLEILKGFTALFDWNYFFCLLICTLLDLLWSYWRQKSLLWLKISLSTKEWLTLIDELTKLSVSQKDLFTDKPFICKLDDYSEIKKSYKIGLNIPHIPNKKYLHSIT